MIIGHMLIFRTNYILTTLSFFHMHNSDPCSHIQPSNHMPLKTKYFLRPLPNHTYFVGETQAHGHNNEGQVKYLAEFGAPREQLYPPWSISSNSIIGFNKIISFLPLVSYNRTGSRKDFGNIVVLTHHCPKMICFGTADDLLQS